jgi:uncharacterized protein (DUF58 family)
MRHPTVPPISARPAAVPGVYTSLDDLARIEHKASGFSFLPRQPVHSLLTGRHASRVRGRGLDFEELRRYRPGDDPRTIDWRVTQRTHKPHVRVFTEERDRPVFLAVDQRLNMFFGTRVAMKSVVAAELAALAAWRVFSQGDRPGGFVFNDSIVREVRPHRSRRRVMELLGAVVEFNRRLAVDAKVEDAPGMLNEVLERVARTAKHDALICLLSDFFGADEETWQLLFRLAEHNDVLCGLVYDPSKADPPEAGRLIVSNGDLQIELDSAKGRLRRTLSDYFTQDLRRIKEELAKVGVPVMLIHTAEDPVEQVRTQLGHLTQAGRR